MAEWVRSRYASSPERQGIIARRCGLHQTTLNRWVHHTITLRSFLTICSAVGADPTEFFSENPLPECPDVEEYR